MDLFDSYQQDLVRLMSNISNALVALQMKETSTSTREELSGKPISQIEREIEEAEELLGQMDLEIRVLPHVQRGLLLQKWKAWKNDTIKYKKELKRLSTARHYREDRRDLLSENHIQEVAPELGQDQHERFLKATEQLKQSSRTLDNTHVIAIETGIKPRKRRKRELL
jgi:vesicle transport through interaction with t-SNAREs protein 1